jgi:hypothetical protein
MNRITYRNLADIFVMQIEDKNIEVGTIEYYLAPFNKYVVIKNIYKYPERVKEYAEACQFTNNVWTVQAAPILRTYAPISAVIGEVVIPALNDSFKRKIVLNYSSGYATFSYYDSQAIEYCRYCEPHEDTGNWLPLHSGIPHNNLSLKAREENMAGIIFLDETFGTEILVNKNISYYHSSETEKLYRTYPGNLFNANYYPERNDSHYEHKITIGGEYNSAVFYYGALPHRPHFPGASDEDLKRGRLTQNLWVEDITEME